MWRKLALAVLAVSLAASSALAQGATAQGTVKAVSAASLTVSDGAKDWVFVVDKATVVVDKGASHKMADLKEAGKATAITEFVREKSLVTVKYEEREGKLLAREVRVK